MNAETGDGEWECGTCHEMVTVRHYLQRDGVMVHDPEAAYAEAAGLVEPEPMRPEQNGSS
jgi:hypothetical protein